MQQKNATILSASEWQSFLQLFWKYLTHLSLTDAL
jgi:hypothetical protein